VFLKTNAKVADTQSTGIEENKNAMYPNKGLDYNPKYIPSYTYIYDK